MKRSHLVLILSAVLLCSCADERVVPQKSPCVGLDDSPCGPKRAVNTVELHPVVNRAYL